MQPFQPADGVQARWVKLAELVRSKEPNHEITYHEAQEALDGVTRGQAQVAMREAQKHLEDEGSLTVGVRPNFGWVVLRAAAHIDESERYGRRVRNAARTSIRKLRPAIGRREELSQFERQALDRSLARGNAVLHLTGRSPKPLDDLLAQGAPPKTLPGFGGT